MNRLRDLEGDGDDPLFQRGVDLLKKTPPASAAADVKIRVWHSIQRASARAGTPAPRRLRFVALNVAMAAIVALAAGSAGAVIARRWIVPALDRDRAAATQAIEPPRRAPPPPQTKTGPVQQVRVAVPEGVDESPAPKAPARTPPRKTGGPAPSAAAVARERTEVLDALVALRREHDPVRAGTLLARYLAAHPRGALREEALVLAIEAADARADRADAAQLSQTYQTEFPAGRFLPFARSHTDRRASH